MRWTPRILATCALLLGWSAGSNLQECFVSAREVVVAMYRSRRRPGESLAGFLQALSSQSAGLLSVVVGSLRGMTIRVSGRQWRWKEWVLMGADGSRVECPMTRSNENGLGCAGKDKTTPQLFLPPLFHVASGLLRALQASGHDFIVRVGRNVHLLRLRGWAVSRQAVELYRLRWGIEVMYRTFKRTLEHHKMRSDTPRRAKVELDWCMAGLWMLGLMTWQAMGNSGRRRQRPSAARALSGVRNARRNASRPRRHGGLARDLRAAVQDSYERCRPKKARHYPRKKTERPAGRPKIRTATHAEMLAAQAWGSPRAPNYFAA